MYAIIKPGWSGPLPDGLRDVIEVPYDVTVWNFRADKYSPTGVNLSNAADTFRRALRMADLETYNANHNAGVPLIVSIVPNSP